MQHEKVCMLRKRKWNGFARRLKPLLAVLIILLVLSCTSCGISKKSQVMQTGMETMLSSHDSMATVTKLIRKAVIPGNRVEISAPADSILRLPLGAVYFKRSGQATLTVSKEGEVIYVVATCDSLQREVEYYEELYYRARDELEQYRNNSRSEKEQSRQTAWNPILVFLIGFAFGSIVIIIFISLKR